MSSKARYRNRLANLYFSIDRIKNFAGRTSHRNLPLTKINYVADCEMSSSPISRVEVSLNVDMWISRREQSVRRKNLRSPRTLIPLKIYFRISRITREFERGYRADYPLSPTLFIYRAEILSHARCPISRTGVPLSIVILSIAHTHVYAPHPWETASILRDRN